MSSLRLAEKGRGGTAEGGRGEEREVGKTAKLRPADGTRNGTEDRKKRKKERKKKEGQECGERKINK